MRTFSQCEPTRLLSSLQGASISQQHRLRCHRIQGPYHQYPQVPTVSLVPCPTKLNTVPTHFTHDETQRVATKPDFHQHKNCKIRVFFVFGHKMLVAIFFCFGFRVYAGVRERCGGGCPFGVFLFFFSFSFLFLFLCFSFSFFLLVLVCLIAFACFSTATTSTNFHTEGAACTRGCVAQFLS